VAVDALSAVLPDLTHEGFGQFFNGGSENDRQQVANAWRTYLHCRIGNEAPPDARAKPLVPAKQPPSEKKPKA
jgi:hypothetical protein